MSFVSSIETPYFDTVICSRRHDITGDGLVARLACLPPIKIGGLQAVPSRPHVLPWHQHGLHVQGASVACVG